MRVIAILEVDEDKVLDAHAVSTLGASKLDGYDSSLEAAIEGETARRLRGLRRE